MYIQTHVLSGWCVGNLLTLSRRERFCCMLAASLPDLDGFGFLISQALWWDFHHVLGHNLGFGVLLSAVLAAFSHHRLKAFVVYLILFHLHLLLDYYGSGPGWGIAYLWPLAEGHLMNPAAWTFDAWQNVAAGYGLVAWTVGIAMRQRRTPLECIWSRGCARQQRLLMRDPSQIRSGAFEPGSHRVDQQGKCGTTPNTTRLAKR